MFAMERMQSHRNILAQYKREVVSELVSASGGQMSKAAARRIVKKHARLVANRYKKQAPSRDAAFAIMPSITKCERVGGGRPPKFSEIIANPIGNGFAALLALAAVGGIGTAIYYAMKKPNASTSV